MVYWRSFLPFFVIAALLVALLPSGSASALGDNYVGPQFRRYYQQHQGMRVLGYAQTGVVIAGDRAVQYFEKGRIEDHSAEVADPRWALMYGRLTAELMQQAPWGVVNNTTFTYGDLSYLSTLKQDPPPEFSGGTIAVEGGTFVPYHPQLGSAPGYVVPSYFWEYMNRSDLFPGGWLHDIGLPMTGVLNAETVKHGERRSIMLQAFERTVLTYDPLNPPGWQVERGNIGTDALLLLGRPGGGAKRIEIDLSRQWLYAFEGSEMVYDAPVSTGKDGFETPAGNFKIFAKYRSKTMSGSAGGESWYVPDVPHAMYFRAGGYAIHGTYWHNQFGTGRRVSHGCVNLPLHAAALLYGWAPIGTPVIIYH
ncbi:MAG: L,D-transpeptidase [Herpetosiphonaceae bacterium]|nr:MAG: L,D-transpeptidase [Herpetosiphonaceae bacterium]